MQVLRKGKQFPVQLAVPVVSQLMDTNTICYENRDEQLYKKIIRKNIDKARTGNKTNGSKDERSGHCSGHDITELKTRTNLIGHIIPIPIQPFFPPNSLKLRA